MNQPIHLTGDLIAEQSRLGTLARALLQDVHVADDAVQDAFLAALERSPQTDRPLGPWLGTVLRNRVRTLGVRSRARVERERDRAREAPEASSPSPEELAERLELRKVVVDLVGGLDEPLRTVVQLRFFEDHSPKEIAQHLGLPAGTVRWRLKVAIDRLREGLDRRHGGDRVAWCSGMVPLVLSDPSSYSLKTVLTSKAMLIPLLSTTAVAGAVVAGVLLTGETPEPGPLVPAKSMSSTLFVAEGLPPAAAQTSDRRGVDASPEDGPTTYELPPSLLAWAEGEIRAAWAETRSVSLPEVERDRLLAEFEMSVLRLPGSLANRRAGELNEVDAAWEDSALMGHLVELSLGLVEDPMESVQNDSTWAGLFQTTHTPVVQDVSSLPSGKKMNLQPGSVVKLPSGVFSFRRLVFWSGDFPADVTFEGAGMNRTLLVWDELSSRDRLLNLAFSDLTLHSNNDYLLDLRREPASVLMERVRAIGFDMGHGSSCLLGTEELAFWARDCIFTGGYGKSLGTGSIFDVRTDGFLARFDGCSFDSLVIDYRRSGPILFRDCSFTNYLGYEGHEFSSGAVLENCSVEPFVRHTSDGTRNPYPKYDLSELFPDWKQGLR